MNPKNKTVWITGASSGIGGALAVAFARHGAAKVILTARRRDNLDAVAADCRRAGAEAVPFPADLAGTAALPTLAAGVEAQAGPVDIFCAAAGVGQRGTALETAGAAARRIMDVDFWSAVELTRALAPGMIRRGSGQIVPVTGVLGKFGAPRRSVYAAAKHALHGWFESLREETLGTGLEITLLVPGWVRTEISYHALEADGQAHGRLDVGQEKGISPEECARRAMPAIIHGRAEQLIGGMECGGVYLNRLWPGLFKKLLRRRGIG